MRLASIMHLLCAFGVVTVALLAMATTDAVAARRIALVIGNSNYENTAPLANPRNDADRMEQTLQAAGFTVTKVIDADFQGLRKSLLEFGRSLRGPDIEASLFFYAGHGIQVRGENFLVPVSAKITSEDEVDFETVNVNDFLRVMNSSDSPINIVVLDACRNNPFARSFRSLQSRGLAPIDAPKGTVVAYATAPGDVAQDGAGSNSPYTKALTDAINQYGQLPIEAVFKKARENVLSQTSDKQVPWETSSMTGDFFFHQGAIANPEPVVSPEKQPAGDDAEVAAKFEVARKIGSESAWNAFLGEYGNQTSNFYVAMARDSLQLLQKPDVEATIEVEPQVTKSLARPSSGSEVCRQADFDVGSATLCVTSILQPQYGNRYGAGNLTDGRNATAWVEGAGGDGIGEYVSVEFDTPVAVAQVRVANGYAKNNDIYAKNNRVRDLVVETADGEQTLRLADHAGWQSLDKAWPEKTKWLVLKIGSVYRGSKYRDTAITGLQIR